MTTSHPIAVWQFLLSDPPVLLPEDAVSPGTLLLGCEGAGYPRSLSSLTVEARRVRYSVTARS